MWRTASAYVYALLVVATWFAVGRYDDARAPLFWRTVVVRLGPGAAEKLAPQLYCDLLDRAQMQRDRDRCKAPTRADSAAPRQAAP